MIMIRKKNNSSLTVKKKTRQGSGKHSKFGHKGGGPNGSSTSKKYRKRYRGQGR